MSSVSLLDVNVLLALFDPDHTHHEIAHGWFAANRKAGWATCALTENGFLRTAGTARTRDVVTISALVDHLRAFGASGYHEFWPDDISLADDQLFSVEYARGPQQLTDIFLLGLAVWRGGRLVTFDPKVPLSAVRGATRAHLEVVTG